MRRLPKWFSTPVQTEGSCDPWSFLWPIYSLTSILSRFTGKDPEPRPGLSSGHIPHSLSLPFSTFLQSRTYTPTGKGAPITFTEMASSSTLHESLEGAVGKELAGQIRAGKRSVTASCGSGMTAGVIWLALKIMGVEKVGLYDEVT